MIRISSLPSWVISFLCAALPILDYRLLWERAVLGVGFLFGFFLLCTYMFSLPPHIITYICESSICFILTMKICISGILELHLLRLYGNWEEVGETSSSFTKKSSSTSSKIVTYAVLLVGGGGGWGCGCVSLVNHHGEYPRGFQRTGIQLLSSSLVLSQVTINARQWAFCWY